MFIEIKNGCNTTIKTRGEADSWKKPEVKNLVSVYLKGLAAPLILFPAAYDLQTLYSVKMIWNYTQYCVTLSIVGELYLLEYADQKIIYIRTMIGNKNCYTFGIFVSIHEHWTVISDQLSTSSLGELFRSSVWRPYEDYNHNTPEVKSYLF